MILSIVIPVYNVEKYIKKCLLSIFQQKVENTTFEVIIVNDGTPDSSMEIVNSLVSAYDNVTIINQENKGLSEARNAGLSCAKGQYVWFIDSDDWIEDNCLDPILKLLDGNVDFLQLQYRYVYDDPLRNQDVPPCIIYPIVSGKEQLLRGGVPTPVQFAIYKKEFLQLHDLHFYPGIYHEDSEFKSRALYFAEKCVSYDSIVYNYYQRSGSIMSKFRLKNGQDILFINKRLLYFIEVNRITGALKKVFYSNVGTNLNTILFGQYQLNKPDRKVMLDLLYKNKSQFKIMFHSGVLKYQIESIFFLIDVRLGLFLHRLFR